MGYMVEVGGPKTCSTNSISIELTLLEITFFLSPDFHELWCSMMTICLLTEVKQQWAMLVLGWVTV